MRYFTVLAALILAMAITPAMADGHGHGAGGNGGGRGGFAARGDMGHQQRMHGPGRGPMMGRPHGLKPLHGILQGIRRQHPGRLSDVRPGRGPNGEPHYRVKWLTPEGRVIWLDVDASTGEVMGVNGADNRGQDGR